MMGWAVRTSKPSSSSQLHSDNAMSGSPPVAAPTGHHRAYKFFEFRAPWQGAPGGIIKVLVHSHYSFRRERRGHARQNSPRILDEGEHPADRKSTRLNSSHLGIS